MKTKIEVQFQERNIDVKDTEKLVKENLKAAGYNYEEAEIAMNPENKVQITDLDTAKKVMALYEALDDLDDVQEVYANFDIADDILAQLD